MHYHLEIILPPTANVEAAVEEIMEPFKEQEEERRYSFFDWYYMGGRWSTVKEAISPNEIITLSQLPKGLTCYRVIIAGRKTKEVKLETTFMIQRHFFNGVNSVEVDWDGTVQQALEKAKESWKWYGPEIQEAYTPKGDWLVVTVDYHS